MSESFDGGKVKEPGYLDLCRKGELGRRAGLAAAALEACTLCPRRCGVNRADGELGFCGAGAGARVYASGAHHGEEPPLSGRRGAGTIFFSNCTMRCIYCQNYPFSAMGEGEEKSSEDLARIMLRLQEEGCHNIELVSPSHYLPRILEALLVAAEGGLKIPLVYNTNAYETMETLRLLEGVVDIYLPDYKYGRDKEALELSATPGYTRWARPAILEMHRQVGVLHVAGGVAVRGIIIRRLVLPSDCDSICESLGWIADNFPRETAVSLMGQYLPLHRAAQDPRMMRRVSEREMGNALDIAMELGLTNIIYQEVPGEEASSAYRGDRIKNTIQNSKRKAQNMGNQKLET